MREMMKTIRQRLLAGEETIVSWKNLNMIPELLRCHPPGRRSQNAGGP